MDYTNNKNIALSLSVWLATDTYAHDDRDNHISVTSLIQPIRSLILQKRYSELKDTPIDISTLLASKIGTAIHDAIERSWKTNYKPSMKSLGHPDALVDKITLNPSDEQLEASDGVIPIITEHRTEKKFGDYIISGEFDFSTGTVEDFKYTGTYTYQKETNTNDYILQLSMYKWLHPKRIKDDIGKINFIFKDWSAFKTYEDNYPSSDIITKSYKLLTTEQIEAYIGDKLEVLTHHLKNTKDDLPRCTQKELWQDDTIYSYYKNPEGKRATKNYTNPTEAYQRLSQDGNVGIVQERLGQVKKCKYCKSQPRCTQSQEYIDSGTLKL